MGTRLIGRAKSGGMLAVLALCYALALQAMLAPPAALAAMARDATAAGHALCDTPGVPHAPDGDGQNACCLPGCAAACAPRTVSKEPPPSILPPVPGMQEPALRTALGRANPAARLDGRAERRGDAATGASARASGRLSTRFSTLSVCSGRPPNASRSPAIARDRSMPCFNFTRFALPAAALAAFVAAQAPAFAHEYKAGAIVIEHPWSRATPAGPRSAAAISFCRTRARRTASSPSPPRRSATRCRSTRWPPRTAS